MCAPLASGTESESDAMSHGYIDDGDGCSADVSQTVDVLCGGRSRCRIDSTDYAELFPHPPDHCGSFAALTASTAPRFSEAAYDIVPIRSERVLNQTSTVRSDEHNRSRFLRLTVAYECMPDATVLPMRQSNSPRGQVTSSATRVFSQGRVVLFVDVSSTAGLNYTVTIDGVTWLQSSATSERRIAHCDGEWVQPVSHTPTASSGVDALGPYDSLVVTTKVKTGSSFVREFR